MIRFIAAVDKHLGLANDDGIPWQGKLPTDVAYYRQKTLGGAVLMGYGDYLEHKQPLADRRNLVATIREESLRPGFEKVSDARSFLINAKQDIWVEGGANLFASTLDLADELYLTRIDHDFHCTKFFPAYEQLFSLKSKGKVFKENHLRFWFEIWGGN